MAYKDEYEVARLLLLPETNAAIDELGGSARNVRWHLHPPMLKALGVDNKMEISARTAPVFRALRAGKRLRGTKLDPFGRMKLRRIERSLIGEFTAAMDSVYDRLTPETLDHAIVIAELPDGIRGYEELKLRRVEEFRRRLAEELSAAG